MITYSRKCICFIFYPALLSFSLHKRMILYIPEISSILSTASVAPRSATMHPLRDKLFISAYQKAHPRAVHKCHLRHIEYNPFAADIFQRSVHLIPQRLGAAMIKLSVQIYDKIVSAFNCSVQNSFTILKPLLRLCLHIYPPVIIISAPAANSLCNLLMKQHCFCKFSLEIVFEM